MWRRRTAAAAIPLIFLVHVATSAVVSVLDQPNARLITWGAKHGCEIRIDRHIQFGNVIPKTKQCFVRVTLPVTYEIDGEAFTLAAAESSTTTVTAVFGDIATTTSEPKAKHRATAHPGAILPALKKHVEEDVYQHVMYLGDIGYEFVKKNAQQFMTDLHPISSQVPFHTVLGNVSIIGRFIVVEFMIISMNTRVSEMDRCRNTINTLSANRSGSDCLLSPIRRPTTV